VHVNGAVYETCLRHRMDGEAHALPQEWLDDLETKEARCDLYEPRASATRTTAGRSRARCS